MRRNCARDVLNEKLEAAHGAEIRPPYCTWLRPRSGANFPAVAKRDEVSLTNSDRDCTPHSTKKPSHLFGACNRPGGRPLARPD